ncbi:hypothetical protein RND71_004670 [Anisodus tanguticus]|uniref:Uncharacterized protein n=1 Tax=Anisodus tanguticus TaxID=243964 RepID=A0AAE1SMI9_9SOLA|nr:hypothetical protein RND71_004670 [Anisodus tanguticus]
MGIWDFINSGKETVKQYTPDLATPVKNVCKTSYYYSTTTVKKIDNVVRVNGLQKLGQYIYMPDEEGQAKIANFSTKFVKNASVYAVKEAANIFIPGGRAVSKIYSETVREMEIESKKNQDMSCVKDVIGNSGKDTVGGRAVSQIYSETVREMQIDSKKNQDTSRVKEIVGNSSKDTTDTGPPRLLDGAEMLESREPQLGSENRVQVDSFAHQTPEDVLRVFMMKEFMGARFLDNLLVADHGQRKKVN